MTVPAEWAPHAAMWVGFPSHLDLWEEHLEEAREETAGLCRALADVGAEQVKLLACGADATSAAAELLRGTRGIDIIDTVFGDIWLRDTGPIFTAEAEAVAFAFNGWGGKYRFAGDDGIAETIARRARARLSRAGFVLEGGALDHDGEGTALATRQCLLNPNRNRGWNEQRAEAALAEALAVRKILWLDQGLLNDHTDGHVDNLARFLAPGIVACPMAFGPDDPNQHAYDRAAAALAMTTDAAGRALRVVRVPSPGRQIDEQHRSLPASHMNFLIANGAVIVPTYEDFAARLAREALAGEFPGRRVIGLPARALLSGGGAFHCISQQQPA
ncbi:MAG TPA: agmatine deiminase family protein [Caulobacteraceae bacterium]|nr:agmatine deiminase family protein [Caulobacteraceae bacterium]